LRVQAYTPSTSPPALSSAIVTRSILIGLPDASGTVGG
jgi:hypothetical protein